MHKHSYEGQTQRNSHLRVVEHDEAALARIDPRQLRRRRGRPHRDAAARAAGRRLIVQHRVIKRRQLHDQPRCRRLVCRLQFTGRRRVLSTPAADGLYDRTIMLSNGQSGQAYTTGYSCTRATLRRWHGAKVSWMVSTECAWTRAPQDYLEAQAVQCRERQRVQPVDPRHLAATVPLQNLLQPPVPHPQTHTQTSPVCIIRCAFSSQSAAWVAAALQVQRHNAKMSAAPGLAAVRDCRLRGRRAGCGGVGGHARPELRRLAAGLEPPALGEQAQRGARQRPQRRREAAAPHRDGQLRVVRQVPELRTVRAPSHQEHT